MSHFQHQEGEERDKESAKKRDKDIGEGGREERGEESSEQRSEGFLFLLYHSSQDES